MNLEELKYAIALSQIKGVGEVTAKKMLAKSGSFEAIFKLSPKELERIEGIGSVKAKSIQTQFNDRYLIERANQEIEFIEKNQLQAVLYTSKEYPLKLKQCDDGPILLFGKGNMDYNSPKIISIVGTRKISDYGKFMIDHIMKGFEGLDIVVVSGLAYGVDSYAHKVAVDKNMQTIGVLAHGLDRIYPPINRKLAETMLPNGGLLTEFISGTNPDRENFPKRNRIIAGLADATLVIESAKKGGSLITAEIANSYSRDVFAVPGRSNDETSEGCNYLIKQNKAHLVESANDILDLMGWEAKEKKPQLKQQTIFTIITAEEQLVVEACKSDAKHIDQLVVELNSTNSKLAILLLELEFKGVIKSLPGKMYRLN